MDRVHRRAGAAPAPDPTPPLIPTWLASGLSAALAIGLAIAGTSAAEDPARAADGEWISLTGTVADTEVERFTLEYAGGRIDIEMDDWDWYDEADRLVTGDRVTVYGRMDDSLYESRTIEAESVYVHDRSTYYYAGDADEEGDVHPMGHPVVMIPDGAWISVSGIVEKVKGREFLLDTGARTVQVDTILMEYDPMDDVGFQKIEAGDRVAVTGSLDLDFFERREIQADSIISLTRDAKKKGAGGS